MEMGRKDKKEKTEIPPEIIEEDIMWRLPVKALARFRSVCKTWNSIIASDPKFAILQLKNSSTTSCDRQRVMVWNSLDSSSACFLENKNQSLTSNNSEFAITKINTKPIEVKCDSCYLIVASCDGLVCILHEVTNSILFWNPLTGETKRVSVPPSGIPPLSPRCTYGLGYDSSTDDYKLVWIKHGIVDYVAGLRKPDEVGVFSLRTNSWRQIQDFPIMVWFLAQGASINGTLYWTGFSTDLLHRCRFEVASFCLEKEKYRLLNIPLTDLRESGRCCGVQALGDKLAVYYQSNVDGSYRLLSNDPCENSESWTEHKVTLPNNDWFIPLCLLENVEEVLFKVSGDHFGIYRFGDGTFRHLHIIRLPRTFHTITFSESLISPNTFKGMKN